MMPRHLVDISPAIGAAPAAEPAADAEPLLRVLGGARVSKIDVADGGVRGLSYTKDGTSHEIGELSGAVLALGSGGMKAVVRASPDLAKAAPELAAASSLGAIDVIACRLWLDRSVSTRSPANVFARFNELSGAGGTYFMLDQLQGNSAELWGGDEPQGSVLACDFYNAGALVPLDDAEIVSRLLSLLAKAEPQFAGVQVVDVSRAPSCAKPARPPARAARDSRPSSRARGSRMWCVTPAQSRGSHRARTRADRRCARPCRTSCARGTGSAWATARRARRACARSARTFLASRPRTRSRGTARSARATPRSTR